MAENKNPFTYPKTRKDETCFDNPNKVADPYRWLEDADSQDTANWVKEQNDITFDYLAKCEHRETLKKTVTDLFNYPKIGCPFRNGKYYYYFKNTGLQNQSILYRQPITETPLQYDEKAEIFFDPNKLSADGTSAINTYSFSESGRYFAYAIAKSGSDWCEIHVKDAVSGEDLKDTLQWVKFSGISWTHDDKGFFYSRFPKPNSLNTETKAGTEVDSNHFHKLYYHVVGTPQEADVLVYENKEEKNYMFNASVTEDGRFLEIYVSRSCEEVNLFHYLDLTHWNVEKAANGAQLPVVKLIDEFDASYNLVANDGELFYFLTNHQAPRKKVICIDLKSPQKENWVDIVAQTEEVISSTTCVHQDHLVVKKMKDVKDVLFLYKLNKASGALVKEIPLPTLGTITSLSSKQKYSELFFNFTSFTFPGSVYRYDVATDSVTLFLETKPQALTFSLSDFEVEQVFYPSKDQTKIPMFIVYKKGLKKDGKNPTLLYGYGGFNISIQPSFSISRLIFMHHFNGVLAVANIRGGGEYGEDWHQQGIKDKKQNCFDDFCAAAEWLVANGYTTPSQIAIQGGSNGGLLVGACMNQRPDLFGCCIAQVGVLDMLRFHKFTIGHYWTSDYGSADEKEGFEYLIKYSPLHNVRKDADYPALLLTTGDHDDRVVPLHSFKFISAVQDIVGSKATQTKPLLIRVETKAGHGAGKPTTKVIEETADIFAFIAKSLNLTWRD